MTHEEFDKLVQRVEARFGRRPEALHRRVLWLALAGYAGLLGPLAFVVALSLAFIIPGILWPQEALLFALIGAVVLALGGWAAGRVLWVRLSAPEGRAVSRAEAPALFAVLDRLRVQLRAVSFHHVLIVPDCNAAVVHQPRLGLLGWHRYYLLIGLPLLEGLTQAELTAVLAHECAHLSKQHHRSGQWIYRLRRSWEQQFEKLAKAQTRAEVSLRPVLQKFIDWFWPRFNAHAFVLSRTHEYQADALAARCAGAPSAAAALFRIACYRRVLEQKFWPELWQLAAAAPTAPEGIFLRLAQAVSSVDAASASKYVAEALRSTTTNADTHPCLSDRLRGIGWRSELPALLPLQAPALKEQESASSPPRPSAAEALLGSALPAIRSDVEQFWRQQTADTWRQHHSKAGLLQERLHSLDDTLAAKQADADALWDKARVFLEMRNPEAAEPLLRQVLAVDAAHIPANFNLGTLLLRAGKAEGEAYLERAVAEDEELLPQAADALHPFYRNTGQAERIRALYARLDRYEKAVAASRLERSNVTASDQFLPHGLPAAELAALRGTLAAEPEVVRANLCQKELRYFVKQKLFLLCLRLRPAWHRLPNADREQAVVQRLAKAVRLPGRVLVFAPSGSFRAVARKVDRFPGSQILPLS